MAKRFRLVPAFQTHDPIPALSKEAVAYQMDERRRDILNDPSLNSDQKLLLYQAMLDNMTRLLGDDRHQRPSFPPTATTPTPDIGHERKLLGIPPTYKSIAQEVLSYLEDQAQRKKINIDWNRRVVSDPLHGREYGELDTIIYYLVSPRSKPDTQAQASRIKQLASVVGLPATLFKNEIIRKLHLTSPAASSAEKATAAAAAASAGALFKEAISLSPQAAAAFPTPPAKGSSTSQRGSGMLRGFVYN